MVVDRIRQWSILFRAHTAMLEAPLAAMGAVLGLQQFWSIEVALWALFGAMYHYSGYGMNSYVDWKKGYDKDDEAKSHHPLNTGKIEPEHAKVAVILSFIATVAFALYLTRSDVLAISLVSTSVVCGIIYNFFGKVTDLKFIPITIAHSLVFLIPYVLYNGSLSGIGIWIFAALIFHHTFQIAISGDVKDIKQDESSLIKTLGFTHTDSDLGETVYNSPYSDFFTSGVTLFQIFIVTFAYLLYFDVLNFLNFALVIVLSFALIHTSASVTRSGNYVRSKRVSKMSYREIIGYWTIYTLSIPIIGIVNYTIGFILSMCYLIIVSKFMWGTYIKPEV